MKLSRFSFLILVLVSAFTMSFVSCDDYDSFTADRACTLNFSSNEVRFDTLITTVPSSTKKLILFNRNEKGLRIQKVSLRKGAGSIFRVNVDGWDMSRTQDNCVSDFEVRRRDSIIVRIEVTMNAFDADTIRQDSDYLDILLESGVMQTVPLYVSGQDAYFLRGKIIEHDTTFLANRPVVIYDSLWVMKGATLKLQPGTKLMFHDGAGLTVFGTLQAKGTLEKPIVFRGDRTDHMFAYLPYDRLPGRWEGLYFKESSYDNELEYVDIHGGNYGIICDSASLEKHKLLLINSVIHQVAGAGLSSTSCYLEVGNTEVSNALSYCLFLMGGHNTFVHCTFAQYYPPNLSTNRLNAVYLSNGINDTIIYPLYAADFYNCLVTGYAEDELMGQMLQGKDDEHKIPGEYLFENCFLTTSDIEHDETSSQKAHFVNNRYENAQDSITHSKHFVKFDAYNYFYDFTPVEHSAIRNSGLKKYSLSFPLDRLGRSRMDDDAPDAGCYEAVIKKD